MSEYLLRLIEGGYEIDKDGQLCIRQRRIPGTLVSIPNDQREALGLQEIADMTARDEAAAAAENPVL